MEHAAAEFPPVPRCVHPPASKKVARGRSARFSARAPCTRLPSVVMHVPAARTTCAYAMRITGAHERPAEVHTRLARALCTGATPSTVQGANGSPAASKCRCRGGQVRGGRDWPAGDPSMAQQTRLGGESPKTLRKSKVRGSQLTGDRISRDHPRPRERLRPGSDQTSRLRSPRTNTHGPAGHPEAQERELWPATCISRFERCDRDLRSVDCCAAPRAPAQPQSRIGMTTYRVLRTPGA